MCMQEENNNTFYFSRSSQDTGKESAVKFRDRNKNIIRGRRVSFQRLGIKKEGPREAF